VLATRELGLPRVPVIVADHLNESEKQAFAIADNQIALHASWDNEVLKVQIELLRQEGMDLKLVGLARKSSVLWWMSWRQPTGRKMRTWRPNRRMSQSPNREICGC
jgi:hypothetical protein